LFYSHGGTGTSTIERTVQIVQRSSRASQSTDPSESWLYGTTTCTTARPLHRDRDFHQTDSPPATASESAIAASEMHGHQMRSSYKVTSPAPVPESSESLDVEAGLVTNYACPFLVSRKEAYFVRSALNSIFNFTVFSECQSRIWAGHQHIKWVLVESFSLVFASHSSSTTYRTSSFRVSYRCHPPRAAQRSSLATPAAARLSRSSTSNGATTVFCNLRSQNHLRVKHRSRKLGRDAKLPNWKRR
jgi:hypothetical protein